MVIAEDGSFSRMESSISNLYISPTPYTKQVLGTGSAGAVRIATITSALAWMRRLASSADTSSRTNGRFSLRMRCISLRILGKSRSVSGSGMSKS